MDKTDILDAIRRCAGENGGRAVGKARFERLTGSSEAQWAGRYWVRWSDAVAEAGYSAGAMTTALPDDVVLDALADLIAELGHYPVAAEFRMRRQGDRSFPDHKVFRRFGNKPELARRVISHVAGRPDGQAIAAICEPIASAARATPEPDDNQPATGQVYLVKSGQLALRLGVSLQAVWKWAKSDRDFPAPLARVGRSVVWDSDLVKGELLSRGTS